MARERLGVDIDVLEAQLAHAKRGDVQKAYDRTTFDDQRREWRVDDARQQQALPAVLGAGRDRLVALAKATGVPWRAVGTADDPFDALAALSNPRRHA